MRDTCGTTPEGGVLLGPERPHTYDDLNDNKKKQFDDDVCATNIVLEGLPKDIYKLINHNIEAKSDLGQYECDAFDSDVDDEPTAQYIFMANLSSAGPTNQQAGPSNESVLSKLHDLENIIDSMDHNAIDLKSGEIKRKNLLITNENLITNCIAQDVFFTDSAMTASRFNELSTAYTVAMNRVVEFEDKNFELLEKN
nr:hypothetical protein [Tanacetum cinerariifolium]